MRAIKMFGLALCLAAPAHAQDADLISAAKSTLASIQDNSFNADREYCGMIGRNSAGNIVITRPRKGRRDSCLPRPFRTNDVDVLASYHTHGSHDPGADAEVPSLDDLRADKEEGVIGFVATPGGRFWKTEPNTDSVRLICGVGCLPTDPDYDPSDEGRVRSSYTAAQLDARERGLDD
ncbi:DUF4329 domain-containing protein [uncultured Litoreibacter sp.]|uniref:DUF4329 domain-containing protein n=1 Tax=uncultured Litoreibacter sp. TaxID=1392394 RepID=UPI002617BB8F|nr:DUF4329 domain-containing protein [uncultured Litoreibacter sp.]